MFIVYVSFLFYVNPLTFLNRKEKKI